MPLQIFFFVFVYFVVIYHAMDSVEMWYQGMSSEVMGVYTLSMGLDKSLHSAHRNQTTWDLSAQFLQGRSCPWHWPNFLVTNVDAWSICVANLLLQLISKISRWLAIIFNIVDHVYIIWFKLAPVYVRIKWLTPKNTPFPHVCYRARFGRSGSNGMSVGKYGPLASRPLRSLKVIGTDTDRSAVTSHYWSMDLATS